jgi:sn-glycerol 3-phosphate transport system permease protein
MVENRPWLTFLTHAVLMLGRAVVAFPLYVTFVASTLTLEEVHRGADAAAAGRPLLGELRPGADAPAPPPRSEAPVGR